MNLTWSGMASIQFSDEPSELSSAYGSLVISRLFSRDNLIIMFHVNGRTSLPLEIICRSCGEVLYSGFDLRSPKDVIRATGNKCKACGQRVSVSDFTVEVSKA